MSDNIILGLDFLDACKAVVDLAKPSVKLNGEVILATLKHGGGDEQIIARAVLSRNVTKFIYDLECGS